MLAPWFAQRDFGQVSEALERDGVLFGPYQTFKELVQSDPRASESNPMFSRIDQPGVGSWLAAGSPVRFHGSPRKPAVRAPRLGEHTEIVLTQLLGLSRDELTMLRRDGTVATPEG